MDYDRLSKRYWGRTAESYDATRQDSNAWSAEQAAVEKFLKMLPPGISLVDIPVGTGRFFEFYKQLGMHPTGIDISADMIEEASKKAKQLHLEARLEVGDIRRINFPDGSFDLAVCSRFLNWVDHAGFRNAVAELSRVSSRYLILWCSHFVPVSGLSPRRLFLQTIKRLRTQVFNFSSKPQAYRHEIHQIKKAFDDNKLKVLGSALTKSNRSGIDTYVYLLEKCSERPTGEN